MHIAVTGIKPTGTPHLGNFLGMIRPALGLVHRYQALYFVADYHALTLIKDGRHVRELTYEAAATWLALGLDPEFATLYRQSDVPEVCELAWMLFCVTPKGLLNRAHAYKAATDANVRHHRDHDAGVSMGLFNYPVLMAADILYPGAHAVPVGLDQKQHLEMADDIARAFNAAYGDILTVPEPVIDPTVMTIPGLDGHKMSKSYGNVIPVLARPEVLRRAVRQIKTDSRPPHEPKDAENDTIFTLFRLVAPESAAASMRERYERGGLGYGDAKDELYEAIEALFREPRERYCEILHNRHYIDGILADGAARVKQRGSSILQMVREAVGANAVPATMQRRISPSASST